MKIRRFYSKNMRSALRQVTQEFGEDAAILSSQKTASGVEVIAALDYDQDLLPSAIKDADARVDADSDHSTSTHSGAKSGYEPMESTHSLEQPTLIESPPMGSSDLERQESSSNSLVQKINSDRATQPKVANIEWTTDPGLVAMREELGLMRSMMSEQLKGIGWERFSEKDPTRAMLTRRLTSLGINSSIINRLIPKVKKQQDAECCWQNLLALLAKSISVNCDDLLKNGGVYAFMGPAGAGKTTTIAKLAARFIIKHGVDSVALISTDNYRISAQQQLASFARLLGVPMLSVSAKHPLDYILSQFKQKKLILIDTAGMSKNDLDIAKQLESLKQTHRDIKRFLLVPATNQLAVIKQSIDLFRRFSPYSVIISKLDEAASLGAVLSLVIENNLPVAFTTDGQRIPEDIRVARNHHLVSKAVWLTNKYGTDIEDWQLAQEVLQAKYA